MTISLRAKGLLGFAALGVFGVLIFSMLDHQHQRLQAAMRDIETLYRLEESMIKVNTSVAHAILHINDAYFSRATTLPMETLLLDSEALQTGLRSLSEAYPSMDRAILRLQQNTADLTARPVRSELVELRASVHVLVSELDQIARDLSARKSLNRENYQNAYDGMRSILLILGGGAVAAFGLILIVFFARLSRDIVRVERRALAIVEGYRGAPLESARMDELGSLTRAINNMQRGLSERELSLELVRQKQFHREKMAAVGGLAASVAHEINNPIAAIQAAAESIESRLRSEADTDRPEVSEARMIIDQTIRIAGITRHLSEFARPQPLEATLVDLNELVRSTCRFVSYDPRMRWIDLEMSLEVGLPAVQGVGDQLVQLLMNLIINAADAITSSGRKAGAIEVGTRERESMIVLWVRDDGPGMTEQVVERAFEEFFTTKGPEGGTGIGLYLCRRLVESHGGTIEIDTAPNQGTVVEVRLPLPAVAYRGQPLGEAA